MQLWYAPSALETLHNSYAKYPYLTLKGIGNILTQSTSKVVVVFFVYILKHSILNTLQDTTHSSYIHIKALLLLCYTVVVTTATVVLSLLRIAYFSFNDGSSPEVVYLI